VTARPTPAQIALLRELPEREARPGVQVQQIRSQLVTIYAANRRGWISYHEAPAWISDHDRHWYRTPAGTAALNEAEARARSLFGGQP